MIDRTAAVVTGAGSGIGRACAELLAKRGLLVVCVGRRRHALLEVAKAIRSAGGDAEIIEADCSSAVGVAAVIRSCFPAKLRAIIYAAGADLVKPCETTGIADLEALFATNVYGPFLITQGLLTRVERNGAITFVSSVAASRGRANHSAYGAAKAALVGMTVNLAVELRNRVRVNCVSPGATDTKMFREYVAESRRGVAGQDLEYQRIGDQARLLLGRIATAKEVAEEIVHVSLDATATTGVNICVDGGYSAS